MRERAWSYLIVIVFIICIGIFGYAAHKDGYQRGVEQYHERCYNIGGIMIDQENNKAVLCKPLGVIPKEELLNNGSLPTT